MDIGVTELMTIEDSIPLLASIGVNHWASVDVKAPAVVYRSLAGRLGNIIPRRFETYSMQPRVTYGLNLQRLLLQPNMLQMRLSLQFGISCFAHGQKSMQESISLQSNAQFGASAAESLCLLGQFPTKYGG